LSSAEPVLEAQVTYFPKRNATVESGAVAVPLRHFVAFIVAGIIKAAFFVVAHASCFPLFERIAVPTRHLPNPALLQQRFKQTFDARFVAADGPHCL
jgi:hypothetical protein